jgi:hypothetical protein
VVSVGGQRRWFALCECAHPDIRYADILVAVSGSPRNLDELRSIQDQIERVKAAVVYIDNGLAKIAEARAIRDAAIRALAAKHGPTEVARRTGVGLSTVKALSRGRAVNLSPRRD